MNIPNVDVLDKISHTDPLILASTLFLSKGYINNTVPGQELFSGKA